MGKLSEEMVEIIISADGKDVSIEGHGFKDNSCHDYVEGLRRKLGTKTRTKKKGEFFVPKQKNTGRIKH